MREIPPDLLALLGRVRDKTLCELFPISQEQLDEIREQLGKPEPSARRVDPLDFVRFWQAADSVAAVAIHFGLTVSEASVKANSYRKHGVPLKRMKTTTGIFWESLRAIASEPTPAKAANGKKNPR